MNNKKKYFYGNEISQYGIDNGYVDYSTLAKSFDAVLCNDITKLFYCDINGEYSEVELYSGNDYDSDNDYYHDIYQYYIIDNNGARILSKETDEIVYYIPTLDIYVWGVTHYGTAWTHVLTEIKIDF